MGLTIRETRYSDAESIHGLLKRHALVSAELSADLWTALWRENPAFQEGPAIPMGWILEDAGAVVGYLGNIPSRYHYRGEQLLAAAARAFAVDVAFRSQSVKLLHAFCSQQNVDLLLNTSANTAAGTMFQLCKARRIPQAGYDTALFWVIEARGFAASVLRKRGHGRAVSMIGGAVLSTGVRLDTMLRRRRPVGRAAALDIDVVDPASVDDEFDEFWRHTLAERPETLLADRSAHALRWHFGHRGAGDRRAKLVRVRRSGRLVGYTALTIEDAADIGLRRTRIADLIAERDDPDLIDALLRGALRQAKANGSHILELVGFPERIRSRMIAGHALARQLPAWPFWYKAMRTTLAAQLQHEDAWYGSSYDGDTSLY